MSLKGIHIKIIFFLLSTSLLAQNNNLRFEHFTVSEGLSENHIMCTFQDSRGFLWIGTQDGLNRYDGYNFKIFKHQPDRLNSLPDYAVNDICEDDEGNLWVATREGLSKFNPVYEKFINYKNDPDNPYSLSSNSVWSVKTDNSGNMWIGTRGGLNLYNKQEDNFIHFVYDSSDQNSLSDNRITVIETDDKNNIWIGTITGLNKYEPGNKKFTRFFNNSYDDKSLSNNVILALKSLNGTLWIGTRNGLNKININDKNKFKKYFHIPDDPSSLSHSQVSAIINQGDNILWLATPSGLNRFNISAETSEAYKHNEFDSKSLNVNFLTSLLLDKSAVLWIGTREKGLNKLNLLSERFGFYTKKLNSKNSLNNFSVQAVFEDSDGTLWIGTPDGINKISSPGKRNESFSFLTEKEGLSQNNIFSIIKDKYGNIWVGTFGGGITKINSVTKSFKTYQHLQDNPGSLSNNFIHLIYEDRDGDIWIGTGLGGVNKYISKTDSFISYINNPNDSNSLPVNEVIAILKDKEGLLWFGTTTGGLCRFDPSKNIFTTYAHQTDNLQTISSSRIVTLFEDKKGRIWIGTFGGGLNLFNKNSETFTHYSQNEGLPGTTVYSITDDKDGNLWLSTNKGISKFNPDDKLFKNYDVNDGLQGNVFNQNSVYRSKISNRIFFGGKNGLSIFDPANIKDDISIPAVSITDFKVFNNSISPGENSILKKSIFFTDELTISYTDNIFSFEFTSLHFANPQKNQFAYMLEGFDKDWIYAGNRRHATYTNLDPGDYIFRVKGSNSDGVWNDEGKAVRIFVTPPVWRTWWAYILYAGLIVFTFFAVRRIELNRVRLRNDLKLKEFEAKKFQEVDQVKSRFFANISHEFRTPLTLILGSLDKLQYKTKDKLNLKDYEVMKRNASRLLQLINQLLELSKIEAGSSKIQASKNDIIKFVKRIIASFSSLAYQKKINLHFNGSGVSTEKNYEELFVYFDKEKFETILYNLLSNAFKFTPEGERIDIDITRDSKYAEINFTNTGIEIPPDKLPNIFNRFYQVDDSRTRNFEGTGIGLALVKELVELHKGEIKAESHSQETNFKIRLPLGKSHLTDEELVEDIIAETKPVSDYEIAETEALKKENKNPVHSDSTIVLIVEDNPDLREFIREHLENEYSILEAENGAKGLSTAEEIIPDLIISDIMMPVMDGYEFSRLLKANEKTNHIPLILLTAKAEIKDKLEGLETGADDYLVKPFNPDELKVRVRNLIRLRQQMREKYLSEMLIKPAEVIVPSTQKIFLGKLTSIIEENLENNKFSIEALCDEIGMSRAQLHRKVKAITNQSTTELIRNFRLQRAAGLITQDAGNMAEVAYKVGFNSQAYFNKSFQELFGCSPTEFKRKNFNEERI